MENVGKYLDRAPTAPQDSAGINHKRCAWLSNGRQCQFPGSITTSTQGSDKWLCRFHFRCEDGPIGEQLVKSSRNYSPDRYQETYADKNYQTRPTEVA